GPDLCRRFHLAAERADLRDRELRLDFLALLASATQWVRCVKWQESVSSTCMFGLAWYGSTRSNAHVRLFNGHGTGLRAGLSSCAKFEYEVKIYKANAGCTTAQAASRVPIYAYASLTMIIVSMPRSITMSATQLLYRLSRILH